MIKVIQRVLIYISVFILSINTINASSIKYKVINIDDKTVNIKVVNNTLNILSFPFIITDASLVSLKESSYSIKVKRDTVTIIPSLNKEDLKLNLKTSLLVWSQDGYKYLIEIKTKEGNSGIFYQFTSNRVSPLSPTVSKFETGNIDQDLKKIVTYASSKSENIPGYQRVKVGKIFESSELTMEKYYIYNGSKYRVEKWLLQNKTNHTITLDESSFYTNGVLGISFEDVNLAPQGITAMYLVLDKATLITHYGQETTNR